MTTQEKQQKANELQKAARRVKGDFIQVQIMEAEATFLTVSPLVVNVGRESIEIIMTENSPRVNLNIQEDWNWENPGMEVKTRMGGCSECKAEDFLAMAKLAPVMETVINRIETAISESIADLNERTDTLRQQAFDLEDEVNKIQRAEAEAAAKAHLDKFNNEVLNQGKIEFDENVSIELSASWAPTRVKAIEVTQKPKQDSFTVTVTIVGWDGETTWTDTTRVCGRFKKNVMGLFK